MIKGVKIDRKSKDGISLHTIVEIDGIKRPLREWVDISGVDRNTIKARYKSGIRGSELLKQPEKRNVKFKISEKESAIIEENFNLIYKCWRNLQHRYGFLDETDLYDSCIDAAIYAARKYDETKGKFSTLFYVAAKKEALKKLRYWDTKARKGTKFNLSLDYQFDNENKDEFIDKYLGIEDKYGFIDNDVVERIFSVLNDREKLIMYKFVIEGMERKDIAKEIGLSPQQTGRIIIIAKEKIRSKLEGIA